MSENSFPKKYFPQFSEDEHQYLRQLLKIEEEIKALEKGEVSEDYSERTVRVCIVNSRIIANCLLQNIAILRVQSLHTYRLLLAILALGVVALIHWW